MSLHEQLKRMTWNEPLDENTEGAAIFDKKSGKWGAWIGSPLTCIGLYSTTRGAARAVSNALRRFRQKEGAK